MFMYQDMVQEVMSLVLSHQSLVHIHTICRYLILKCRLHNHCAFEVTVGCVEIFRFDFWCQLYATYDKHNNNICYRKISCLSWYKPNYYIFQGNIRKYSVFDSKLGRRFVPSPWFIRDILCHLLHTQVVLKSPVIKQICFNSTPNTKTIKQILFQFNINDEQIGQFLGLKRSSYHGWINLLEILYMVLVNIFVGILIIKKLTILLVHGQNHCVWFHPMEPDRNMAESSWPTQYPPRMPENTMFTIQNWRDEI